MNQKQMAEIIAKSGGRLYLVGGAVRDSAMHLTPKDYDYCVTGLSKEEFSRLFPNAIIKGKDFPVFDIEGNEFALARNEKKTGVGHKDFTILTDKSITIEEDLCRRDFTINSIAYDILSEQIIDPFGGVDDIKNGIIRATSLAFRDDPLRVYRAARFAAKYNFKIEDDTLKLMEKMKDELSSISAERVFEEFRKSLSYSYPSNFFQVLRNCKCLSVHFSEIEKMIGVPQPLKYHPEGDVYNHTMEVLDKAAETTDNELIRFSALVHDFGKILTPPEILPHHYEHENNGRQPIKEFCKRLKMPKNFEKAGISVSKEHMRAGKFNELTTKKKVDFIVRSSKSPVGLEGLEIIANCDGNRKPKIEFSEIGKKMLSEVNGKTVDVKDMPKEQIQYALRQKRIEWLNNYLKRTTDDISL